MVKESTIRLITRISDQHNAVNLGQGFTDEAAVYDMVWGAISASLGGNEDGIADLNRITLGEILQRSKLDSGDFLKLKLKDALKCLQGKTDVFNQYSYPFGMPELRNAIADYTERFSGFRPDPDKEITVVVGATEGLFTSLKTICKPGDEIIVMQPFHEMYRLQSASLDLRPKYITLRANQSKGTWELDRDELEASVTDKTKALVFNTPQNPTGKVFTREEMEFIGKVCKKHGTIVVTDEIYEHILFTPKKHISMAAVEGMRDSTFVVNAVSKTANATGWRVGWIITPPKYTGQIRAIHDTIVLQSPTPLQKGVISLLTLSDDFYKGIRNKYIEKLDMLIDNLRQVGFKVIRPEGAYYLFADYSGVPSLKSFAPMDAAMHLIKEAGVASIPGDNFYAVGDYGDKFLRFAFCRSMKTIEEGAKRLKKLH